VFLKIHKVRSNRYQVSHALNIDLLGIKSNVIWFHHRNCSFLFYNLTECSTVDGEYLEMKTYRLAPPFNVLTYDDETSRSLIAC